MQIIDEGNPKAPHPHRCQRALWDFERQGRPNMGTVVECDCGAWWRVQAHEGVWSPLFGEYHRTYNGTAYWVRIRRGRK